MFFFINQDPFANSKPPSPFSSQLSRSFVTFVRILENSVVLGHVSMWQQRQQTFCKLDGNHYCNTIVLVDCKVLTIWMQPYYYLVIVCIIKITCNYLAWVKLEWCILKCHPGIFLARFFLDPLRNTVSFNKLHHNLYCVGRWFALNFHLYLGVSCFLVIFTNLNLLTLKVY